MSASGRTRNSLHEPRRDVRLGLVNDGMTRWLYKEKSQDKDPTFDVENNNGKSQGFLRMTWIV
jgi:hypothetical protein